MNVSQERWNGQVGASIGKLRLNIYEDAVVMPRMPGRRSKHRPIGLFANGVRVPWSDSGVAYADRPTSDCRLAREERVECRNETVLFIGTLWCIWGHPITDLMRHLWPLLALDGNIRVAYALGSPKQRLPVNFRGLLEALGVSSDRLVEVRQPTRFRRVLFGEPSFWHTAEGKSYSSEYSATVEAIIRGVLGTSRMVQRRRVYLTRTGQRDTKGRKDFGEREVEAAYRRAGFEIVSPECLDFAEMVRMLAETDVLAATEGSVSHNALFLPRGSRIEILCKLAKRNGYQMAIDRVRDLKVSVYDVRISRLLAVPNEPWRGPFMIGVTSELAKHLGCEPTFSRLERLKYFLCLIWMWLKAHRI